MISKLEILPNEIFFNVFSHLLWNDILTSFWSLNKRFNSLICLHLSINKSGIIITKTSLSYKIFLSKLFPLISNCSSLINSIRHIHLDGRFSNSYDFFNENRCIYNYPNLKSLILDRFYLSESLIDNLYLLIENRLNELTMILDEDIFTVFEFDEKPWAVISPYVRHRLPMFKNLLCEIFSKNCQLINLRLDIPCNQSYMNIHQWLPVSYGLTSNLNKATYCCKTLRYVNIRLHYACFIEYIIEHAPNIERLSVYLKTSWNRYQLWDLASEKFEKSNTISSDKKFRAEKLKYFILKSTVDYDCQLYYLKWLFNNLNSVENIKIYLKIHGNCEKNPIIYGSIVDANFICKYLMSDTIINLIHFDFYIVSKCKLSSNYNERTINSFKNHSFFIERHWTNVKCLFDEIKFYQHLCSSPSTINNLSEYFHDLITYPDIFDWPNIKYVEMDINKNVYSYLERFDKYFPNVSCIKFNMERNIWFNNSNYLMEQPKLINICLQYVTRLDFGLYFHRAPASNEIFVNENKERAKKLARIISMPVQLNYLRIEKFQWLLHLVEYAFDELKENALSNVRYTEFSLPSCHFGTNESIRLGKCLVPFLSKYMPHLQTLCLWRPDDFPWSSIRPDFNQARHELLIRRWSKSLETVKSINKHVILFEKDLSQLVEQLKQFVYLNIYGYVNDGKVEPYRLMIEKRFPNTYVSIEKSRFRLWI